MNTDQSTELKNRLQEACEEAMNTVAKLRRIISELEPGEEGFELSSASPKRTSKRFFPPSLEDVTGHFLDKGLNGTAKQQAENFWNYHNARGWLMGRGIKMQNWKSAAATWLNNHRKFESQKNASKNYLGSIDA